MQDCARPTAAEPICNERSQINYERFRCGNEGVAAFGAASRARTRSAGVTCNGTRASRPEELLGNPKK